MITMVPAGGFFTTSHPQRLIGLLCVLLVASACGRMDYRVQAENFRPENAAKSPELATITYRYSDSQAPYDVTVRKVPRGYALEAPVYHDSDMGMESHFAISRTRELGNFVGLQTSFSF